MAAFIIVNANAGRFRRRSALIDEIQRHAGATQVVVTRTVEELHEHAAASCRRGDSPIVLCGGDGTHRAGVTAFARLKLGQLVAGRHATGALPRFVFPRAGSVGTASRGFGHRASLLDTIRLVANDASLTYRARATIRVQEEDNLPQLGFTFGTGLVARFFEEYYERGTGGYAQAASLATRVLLGAFTGSRLASRVLTPMPCLLTVDGKRQRPPAYSLIVCSVLRDVGLRILVTYRASEDPERPHLVALPLPPRELGRHAWRVVAGVGIPGADNVDRLVDSFEVEFDEAGQRPTGYYVLDGDILRAAKVSVSAGPRIEVATV